MIERLFLGLLFALVAAAPTAGDPDPGRGLGGTGHTMDDGGSGIGGTGHQPSGDGRGIGGTGIVGTISAFGSIWVNGVEVDYPADQTVSLYDRPATGKDLRVGQVVSVEAESHGDRLVARSIEVRHAVVGPVTSIDARNGTMQVLGQRVRMPAADPISQTLRRGQWVAVSGLREPKGVIVASLLEQPPRGVGAFVRGEVERVDARGVIIGGHRYRLPPGTDPSTIPGGVDLTVYGEPAGDGLAPTRLREGWLLPFDGRVRNFLVEGFMDPRGRRIGALSLPDWAYRPRPGERVVVQGRFGADGALDRQSLRVRSAPRGLDGLRLRLDDVKGADRTTGSPAHRETQQEAGPSGPYPDPQGDGTPPPGLSPSGPSPGDRLWDPVGRPTSGQGSGSSSSRDVGRGWPRVDPPSPGFSSGSRGFPMSAPPPAPRGAGGSGGGRMPSASPGGRRGR
jgi:hypothetical protein